MNRMHPADLRALCAASIHGGTASLVGETGYQQMQFWNSADQSIDEADALLSKLERTEAKHGLGGCQGTGVPHHFLFGFCGVCGQSDGSTRTEPENLPDEVIQEMAGYISRADAANAELASIDRALEGRDALRDCPTRAAKIARLCQVAGRAEKAEAELASISRVAGCHEPGALHSECPSCSRLKASEDRLAFLEERIKTVNTASELRLLERNAERERCIEKFCALLGRTPLEKPILPDQVRAEVEGA